MVRVLAGYDGSLPAGAAIDVCGRLLPDAEGWVAHVWTPPFASEPLRRRLWRGTQEINQFVADVEREGRREADRVAAMGVAVARAAGWVAQPLVARAYAGEGVELTELARSRDTDLVVVGSRGLSGAHALLGSVSDMVVHYATQPVLVAPYPLLVADYVALPGGPVLVGWDGSAGAATALAAARRLWPEREVVAAGVGFEAGTADDGAGPPVPLIAVAGRPDGPAVAVAGALAAEARRHGAAVLVVGSRGRSPLREIVLGSVAMSTLHHAHRLTLVVPHAED